MPNGKQEDCSVDNPHKAGSQEQNAQACHKEGQHFYYSALNPAVMSK